MGLARIQVIGRSLELIGIPAPGNQIDPNNRDQVTAAKSYDFLYPAELAKEDWRFATKVTPLSQNVTPPTVDRWRFSYQLPAGVLAIVRTYPNTQFQIYEDNIFTNSNKMDLEYRFQVGEAKVPMLFSEYMILVLAEYLSLAIAEKIGYVSVLAPKVARALGKAAYIDAQNHPNFEVQDNPFLDVRTGGSSISIRGRSG